MDWQPWLVFSHVVGGFTFVLAHGVSVFVALKLRSERDPVRVTALLDLSRYALPTAVFAVLFQLLSGIAAGFVGGYWGHVWIWASIAILVLLFLFMGFRGTEHLDALRHAAGQTGLHEKKGTPAPEPDLTALTALLDTPRGMELAVVGSVGLILLLYLMAFKPF